MEHIFLARKEAKHLSPHVSPAYPSPRHKMTGQGIKCGGPQITGCQDIRITLSNRRLSWLGHVNRMPEGRLPQDILYGSLASGQRPAGRPKLRYVDVCKRDMKHLHIDTNSWEVMAQNRPSWVASIREGSRFAEEDRSIRNAMKRSSVPHAVHTCTKCDRACASRIGLLGHMKACKGTG